MWRHKQGVCNTLIPSSNLGVASIITTLIYEPFVFDTWVVIFLFILISTMQPHLTKINKICYLWLIDFCATVDYNIHINQIWRMA